MLFCLAPHIVLLARALPLSDACAEMKWKVQNELGDIWNKCFKAKWLVASIMKYSMSVVAASVFKHRLSRSAFALPDGQLPPPAGLSAGNLLLLSTSNPSHTYKPPEISSLVAQEWNQFILYKYITMDYWRLVMSNSLILHLALMQAWPMLSSWCMPASRRPISKCCLKSIGLETLFGQQAQETLP